MSRLVPRVGRGSSLAVALSRQLTVAAASRSVGRGQGRAAGVTRCRPPGASREEEEAS